jgi:hypothetical protein
MKYILMSCSWVNEQWEDQRGDGLRKWREELKGMGVGKG